MREACVLCCAGLSWRSRPRLLSGRLRQDQVFGAGWAGSACLTTRFCHNTLPRYCSSYIYAGARVWQDILVHALLYCMLCLHTMSRHLNILHINKLTPFDQVWIGLPDALQKCHSCKWCLTLPSDAIHYLQQYPYAVCLFEAARTFIQQYWMTRMPAPAWFWQVTTTGNNVHLWLSASELAHTIVCYADNASAPCSNAWCCNQWSSSLANQV